MSEEPKNLKYEYWRDLLKNYEFIESQQLVARYQVGLIIIPTIVGFWGFIGLIVSSNHFIKHPFFIDIVACAGTIITFFLLWMWRTRVHDIASEEMRYKCQHAKIEAELFLRKSLEEDIETLVENDFFCDNPVSPYNAVIKKIMKKNLPADFYEHLHSEKKLYKFYKEFREKFDKSNLDNIDNWTRYAIITLGLIEIVFSGFLLPYIFGDVEIFNRFLSSLSIESGLLSIIFTCFFVAFSFAFMWFFGLKLLN